MKRKVSGVCSLFKKTGKRSSTTQYRLINPLSIISKVFEFIINKNVVEYLDKTNSLASSSIGLHRPDSLLTL